MKKIRLFTIEGGQPTADQAFSWIMNVAVDALVQKKFKNATHDAAFELSPQFITEAYEGLKHVDAGGYKGQQLQEFLITSILQKYLELGHTDKTFLLALPDDLSVDAVIVESVKGPKFKIVGDAALMQDQVTIYPFQIKEMREEDNIFSIANKGSDKGTERLMDSKMFKGFMEKFMKKIIGDGSYKDTIPLLFMRASTSSSFKVPEISLAFQEVNNGYFKQVWLISTVHDLVNDDGSKPPASKSNLQFLVHNLLTPVTHSDKDQFVIVSMKCDLRKFFPKR